MPLLLNGMSDAAAAAECRTPVGVRLQLRLDAGSSVVDAVVAFVLPMLAVPGRVMSLMASITSEGDCGLSMNLSRTYSACSKSTQARQGAAGANLSLLEASMLVTKTGGLRTA